MRLHQTLGERRMEHVLGTEQAAVRLARRFGVDVPGAAAGALLHDCAKSMDDRALLDYAGRLGLEVDACLRARPSLLHGPVGSAVAGEQYGIEDPAILQAIACHTTGRVGMSALDKVIYLADVIERSRSYPGVRELRQMAERDLDRAVLMAMDQAIMVVLRRKELLLTQTVEARNWLMAQGVSGGLPPGEDGAR
ncbi:phosphohydrolase [Bacteroidia bacterium]|nr:phosphohydrolase [Bacteroidia bacterium]